MRSTSREALASATLGVSRRAHGRDSGGRRIIGPWPVRQQLFEQLCLERQREDEEEGKHRVEAKMKPGRHSPRIGLDPDQVPGDLRKKGQHRDTAEDAVEEIADRQPKRAPLARSRGKQGIERAAKVGAQRHGHDASGVTSPLSAREAITSNAAMLECIAQVISAAITRTGSGSRVIAEISSRASGATPPGTIVSTSRCSESRTRPRPIAALPRLRDLRPRRGPEDHQPDEDKGWKIRW